MQSCDVYFYNVGYDFYSRKGEALEDWAKRLGMGNPTGIDLPGEVAGLVPDARVEEDLAGDSTTDDRPALEAGDSINLAIGQGNLEATPLQLADPTPPSPTAATS